MRRYLFGGPTLGTIERFNRVTHPVFVYDFDDGLWAMPTTINVLMMHFTNTWVGWWQITPAQADSAVGHTGFFHVQFATTLWPDLVDWLRERAATTCNEAGAA